MSWPNGPLDERSATHRQADLVFRALADPTRRAILDLLHEQADGLPATAIAARFPEMSRPAVAKHLSILREAGFVTVEARGRERRYALSPQGFAEVYEAWFARYTAFWRSKLGDLKRFVESGEVDGEKDTERDPEQEGR